MSEHDSHDDPTISALYRSASQEAPSRHLDERVMVTARRHVARRSHRWWLPLSTAAVLVLAITLLLRHQQAPDELQEQFAQLEPAPAAVPAAPAPATPRKEERVAAKPESRAKSSVAEAPLAEAPLADSAKSVAPPAAVAAAPSQSPALAAAPTADMAGESRQAEAAGAMARSGIEAEQKREAATEAAEPWLKRIEALRVKGEIEAARRELAAFRKAYPAWPLSKELQALLPAVEK